MKTKKSYAKFTPQCNCTKHETNTRNSQEESTQTFLQRAIAIIYFAVFSAIWSLILLFGLTYWEGKAGFAYTFDHFYNLPITIVFFLGFFRLLYKNARPISSENDPFEHHQRFNRDSLNPGSPSYMPMAHEQQQPPKTEWDDTRW